MTIKTLDWIKQEATKISAAWNGSDEKFTVEDEIRTDDDAQAAKELLSKLEDVEALVEELKI